MFIQNRAIQQPLYTKAGMQSRPFGRMAVASGVNLPEAYDDGRECLRYRAPKEAAQPRRGISLALALLLLFGVTAAVASQSLQRLRTSAHLKEELDTIREAYASVVQEQERLEANIAKACDSSYVCYYAARELGMKLAVNQDTIQIVAQPTRTGT